MSARSARRLLLAALALSLLLHLLGVRLIHWGVPTTQELPESVKLIKISTVHARPTQSPRPPVAKRPRAKAINVPKLAVHRGQAAGPIAVSAGSPAPPTPAPAPAPVHLATPSGVRGCAKANAVAAVLSTPPPPDIPAQARRSASAGVTQVRVQLNDRGEVVDAAIASSSGNAQLDQVALELAKGSSYTPDVVGCKKVAATYTYRVRFEPATTGEVR
jgi:TonB family protein